MHLAKKYWNFLGKACQNVFATAHVISYLFSSHLTPSMTLHSVALQTASVAADDRLMKRVQSQPGWMVLHMQQKALTWCHGGFNEPAVIQTRAQSYMDTLRWEGGGDPGGARVTYSTERNVILDNCKHSRATWTVCSNIDAFHSHLPCWWLLILYNEHTSAWFQWHLEG